MKNIILAWLNANATNEAKAKEIEYHSDKFASEFAIGFAEWLIIIYNEDIIYDAYSKKKLLEIYKKEKGL